MIVKELYLKAENLDQFKSNFARDTKLRKLSEAIKGADVFLGLSVKNVVSQDMVKSMSSKPIIFAKATLILKLCQKI